MSSRRGSRVARTAAVAGSVAEDRVIDLLARTRVGIELEDVDSDSGNTLRAVVRQAVLIWRRVVVTVLDRALIAECLQISEELRPGDQAVVVTEGISRSEFDAVLHIGRSVEPHPRVVTVSNTGWVVHFVAGASSSISRALPPRRGRDNPLGAFAAAALGVGELFLRTILLDRADAAFDLSIFDYQRGALASLEPGPALPGGIEIDGALIGAGTVSAGCVYALAPFRVRGRLDVVDQDAARPQNFGPHLFVSTQTDGIAKADLVGDRLRAAHPELQVTSRVERFRLFRYRLVESTPSVVISGLDRARPRQDVQRLWAPLHVDMATKDGLQVQVLVRTNPGHGICLIKKFPSDDETDEEEELARRTGLAREALLSELENITEADVSSAPAEFRDQLRAARASGDRRCNVITRADLDASSTDSDEFVGSAPFSALLAGVFAAGELLKSRAMALDRDGLLAMWHFVSQRAFVARTRCDESCECSTRLAPEATPSPRHDGAARG